MSTSATQGGYKKREYGTPVFHSKNCGRAYPVSYLVRSCGSRGVSGLDQQTQVVHQLSLSAGAIRYVVHTQPSQLKDTPLVIPKC